MVNSYVQVDSEVSSHVSSPVNADVTKQRKIKFAEFFRYDSVK